MTSWNWPSPPCSRLRGWILVLGFSAAVLPDPARADIALANFCGDTNAVAVSIKLPSGEGAKLGDFTSGQVTGFMGLAGKTDYSFTHPSLGTKTLSLPATNSPHFLIFTQIRLTNAPGKPPEPSLILQKWPLPATPAKGYQAVNLCDHPVTFLLDEKKKIECPASKTKFDVVDVSPAKSVTIARPDGSDPITYKPEEPAPYLLIFYPVEDAKKFGWTAQPLP